MLAFSFAIAQEVWHFSQMAQRLSFFRVKYAKIYHSVQTTLVV
jgi:hypothetical protein